MCVVCVEALVNHPFAARSVVETVLIRDNPYVGQVIEEDERSELIFLILARGSKSSPIRTGTTSIKICAEIMEGAPNKTGTVEHPWPCGAPHITCSESLLDLAHQQLI